MKRIKYIGVPSRPSFKQPFQKMSKSEKAELGVEADTKPPTGGDPPKPAGGELPSPTETQMLAGVGSPLPVGYDHPRQAGTDLPPPAKGGKRLVI